MTRSSTGTWCSCRQRAHPEPVACKSFDVAHVVQRHHLRRLHSSCNCDVIVDGQSDVPRVAGPWLPPCRLFSVALDRDSPLCVLRTWTPDGGRRGGSPSATFRQLSCPWLVRRDLTFRLTPIQCASLLPCTTASTCGSGASGVPCECWFWNAPIECDIEYCTASCDMLGSLNRPASMSHSTVAGQRR
jgi:hypothetical protein